MSQPSIKKNYIYKLLYECLTIITPLITAPYVSRVLGADGIGVYSYTNSILTYFTLFAALGTVSYGTREIAQHRDDRHASSKLFWEIELMTLMTTAGCLLIWCGLILVSSEYKYYFLALIPQLLATAADISWFYTGHEKVGYTVFWNSICKILGTVLIFVLVKSREDLVLYILLTTGVHFIGNMSMWVHLPGMLTRVDMHTLTFKRHFQETLIYFVPAIATSVYTVLDKTLIGVITKNTYENGYYEQATKIITICKTLSFAAVNNIMKARMSYLFGAEKFEEIHKRIEKSMSFILMIGFGCVAGIIGVAPNFVPVFFGSGYDPVIELLYYMVPLVIIVGISNCLGAQYYTPSGQRIKSAKVVILGAVVNLFMNLILIPQFGAIGATTGSIVAELIITVLYLKMCGDYMTLRKLWGMSKKRIVAAAIMCVVVVSLQNMVVFGSTTVTICVQVVTGVATYGILLLIFQDELIYEYMGHMIRKLKKAL